MTTTLRQAEAMIDALDSYERLSLLKYLVPKLTLSPSVNSATVYDDLANWEKIQELGLQMASEPNTGLSALQHLDEMRR